MHRMPPVRRGMPGRLDPRHVGLGRPGPRMALRIAHCRRFRGRHRAGDAGRTLAERHRSARIPQALQGDQLSRLPAFPEPGAPVFRRRVSVLDLLPRFRYVSVNHCIARHMRVLFFILFPLLAASAGAFAQATGNPLPLIADTTGMETAWDVVKDPMADPLPADPYLAEQIKLGFQIFRNTPLYAPALTGNKVSC